MGRAEERRGGAGEGSIGGAGRAATSGSGPRTQERPPLAPRPTCPGQQARWERQKRKEESSDVKPAVAGAAAAASRWRCERS